MANITLSTLRHFVTLNIFYYFCVNIMKKNHVFIIGISLVSIVIGCRSKEAASNATVVSSTIHRQSCTESIGFSGKWRLVNIKDSGRNKKPNVIDTLVVSDCSTMERYMGGKLVSKDEFKLYKMTNYCADYQLVYKNDSIGCINILKDTLIFSECSDFETTRYCYKRVM